MIDYLGCFVDAFIKSLAHRLFMKTDKIKIDDKDLFLVDEGGLIFDEKNQINR